MAKKKPVSRITPESTPSVNIESFTASSDLPTTEQAVKTVEALTGQSDKSELERKLELEKLLELEIKKLDIALRAENAPKSYGRPKKEKAIGREPFTTSLHSDFVMLLKDKANKRRCTVADLLDKILSEHLHNY